MPRVNTDAVMTCVAFRVDHEWTDVVDYDLEHRDGPAVAKLTVRMVLPDHLEVGEHYTVTLEHERGTPPWQVD